MKRSSRYTFLFYLSTFILSSQAMALTLVNNFGSNPGNLEMYEYIPTDMPPQAPLVLVLHGCTQTANSYDQDTGWSDLAERKKFYVIYAQQKTANNYSECFNWFDPADYQRERGEAKSIKSMIDKIKNEYTINNDMVYVTGVSAGGAMAANMMAAYPDVFAGGGVMAGIPYACATGVFAGLECMSGIDKTPQQWGDEVRGAYPGFSGPYPVLSVFHGTVDDKVDIFNANELMEQWTDVHDIDQTPEVDENFRDHNRRVYNNASGDAVVEIYEIEGMSHGISVDPGSGEDEGGNIGANSFAEGIWSTYYAAKFWGIIDGDAIPEVFVNISSPANGSMVNGIVTLKAVAGGIDVTQGVDFFINDIITCTDTEAPYACAWDTTAVADGSYDLIITAYAAASGDPLEDNDTTVVVNNSIPSCQDWYTSNYTHVMDSRAYTQYGFVYANGSDEQMGFYNIFNYNWLREKSSGYYEIGMCP